MKRDYSRIKKIIAGAAAIGIAAAGIGAMEHEPAPVQVIEYTVQPGDTLWHIAAEHTDDSEDIREVVAQIKADSGIESGGHLTPGQKIVIKKELPDVPPSDNSHQLR